MLEHVAIVAAKLAGKEALARLQGLTTKAAMNEAIKLSAGELFDQFCARVMHLEATALDRAEAREQFPLLFARLYVEGIYAASRERRQLIANALGGLLEFDEGAELQSRVARAVLQLEPSDVTLLAYYRKNGGGSRGVLPFRDRSAGGEPSHEALASAGCVADVGDGGEFAQAQSMAERSGQRFRAPMSKFEVTALGIAVLKYLAPGPADSSPDQVQTSGR